MREINFRGYSKSRGWVFGSYATDQKDYHAIIVPDQDDDEIMINIIVDPDSVGQYTGLKGKDGVEIYDGDVLKGRCDLGGKLRRFIGAVDFNLPNIVVKGVKQYHWKICHSVNDVRQAEVIGNIYENPELLD